LRTDDMLESGDKFRRQPPMGYQNHADHRTSSSRDWPLSFSRL
jgi:hypothetical protein